MTKPLYNRDILRLASELSADKMLSVANSDVDIGNAAKSTPICGSKASAKVAIDDNGVIVDAVLNVNSCALGQASAALLLEYMQGKDSDGISAMRSALICLLSGEETDCTAWPKVMILQVAAGYSARYSAILLPYDALLEAIDDAQREAFA